MIVEIQSKPMPKTVPPDLYVMLTKKYETLMGDQCIFISNDQWKKHFKGKKSAASCIQKGIRRNRVSKTKVLAKTFPDGIRIWRAPLK